MALLLAIQSEAPFDIFSDLSLLPEFDLWTCVNRSKNCTLFIFLIADFLDGKPSQNQYTKNPDANL